jgi:hypothetical protein
MFDTTTKITLWHDWLLQYEMEQLFSMTEGSGNFYLDFEPLWNFIVKRTKRESDDGSSETRCGSIEEAFSAIVDLCGGKETVTLSELIRVSFHLTMTLEWMFS